MQGNNPLVHEGDVLNSEPSIKGFPSDIGLNFGAPSTWFSSAGAALATTAAAAPYRTVQNSHVCATWRQDGTATLSSPGIIMPDELFQARQTNERQDLVSTVFARKTSATPANEVAALKINGTLQWIKPDGTADSVSSVQTASIAAAAADPAFLPYTLDWGAALKTAGKVIPRGSLVTMILQPSAQVGTTDNQLHIAAVKTRFRRHACTLPKSARL